MNAPRASLGLSFAHVNGRLQRPRLRPSSDSGSSSLLIPTAHPRKRNSRSTTCKGSALAPRPRLARRAASTRSTAGPWSKPKFLPAVLPYRHELTATSSPLHEYPPIAPHNTTAFDAQDPSQRGFAVSISRRCGWAWRRNQRPIHCPLSLCEISRARPEPQPSFSEVARTNSSLARDFIDCRVGMPAER